MIKIIKLILLVTFINVIKGQVNKTDEPRIAPFIIPKLGFDYEDTVIYNQYSLKQYVGLSTEVADMIIYGIQIFEQELSGNQTLYAVFDTKYANSFTAGNQKAWLANGTVASPTKEGIEIVKETAYELTAGRYSLQVGEVTCKTCIGVSKIQITFSMKLYYDAEMTRPVPVGLIPGRETDVVNIKKEPGFRTFYFYQAAGPGSINVKQTALDFSDKAAIYTSSKGIPTPTTLETTAYPETEVTFCTGALKNPDGASSLSEGNYWGTIYRGQEQIGTSTDIYLFYAQNELCSSAQSIGIGFIALIVVGLINFF